MMRFVLTVVASVCAALSLTAAQSATSVLFIGNSFTYAAGLARPVLSGRLP